MSGSHGRAARRGAVDAEHDTGPRSHRADSRAIESWIVREE